MSSFRPHRPASAVALAALATAALVMPVAGANQVPQTINAGTRTASIADLSLSAVNYSHSAQSNTGTMVLTADDSSGTGAGWNVTVQSSAFVYSGANGGTNIPAANFSITSAAAPTRTAGQSVDVVGGPNAPALGSTGSLEVARKTVSALVGFGQGTYSQNLDVSLSIPALSRVGTYTGTMTVTISAGP
ncbi:MAG TPA: WxL domain-containing protein [Candidatus Limnocylindria bacterium]|nr:WxL domain-containing protein [Candidatus Limnocylindria bacterium]